MAVECVLCKRKGLSNPYAKEDSLFAHFYDSHIRLYYKCTDCNRAFAEKTSIYAHRNEFHGNNNGNEKGTEKKLLLNKNAAGNNNRKSRITLKQKEDEQQKSLQRGRRQSATMQSDFSVLYKAAFLKAPHRLFSTREALESRLTSLIKTWRREFKFTCFSCETLFDNVGDLRDHNTTWCQMQNTRKSNNFSSNNWGASAASAKLFDRSYNHLDHEATGAGGNRSADLLPDLTQNETYEKMNQHLANLEALSSSCPDCQKIGLDYRAHLVHHTKHGLTATSTSSDARSAKTCSTEIHQVESALPASPATSSPFTSSNLSLDLQNTSSSPVVRITRQRLEAAARPTSTEPTNLIANNSPTPSNKTSKKAAVAEVKATAEANSFILEAAESKLGSSAITVTPSPLATNTTTTPTTNRKIKKKKFKSDKQAAMALVEVLGIRQPQDRHLMKINKVHKKALSFGATAIPISPEKKAGGGSDECRSFECGLCDFSSELRQKFSAHISLHNPEGHLQCQMCGMCFASEPSWKRHLFLLHRIKRPQPYDYCQALTTTTNLEEQQSLK